ncbi:uncharacterized protein LOC142790839 isoform X1 [Rhipicephalus microplus]|uniref:uncharacterized protein LOC142790839 isoform X1 n=1 Tax=Rhipicephalus microplus TaxID=6941 RepID=UPI003F6B181F
MRPVVVIILVIALTIQLFEEALSKISRPKVKRPKLKKPKISRLKHKTTRTKQKIKVKTPKKPAAATDTHVHHGFGGMEKLYVAQTITDSVSSLGTTGTGIAGVVLQQQAANAQNNGASGGEQEGEESTKNEE